ncbi:efflux RND transporter periplasmic adaptor subunit [Sporolactobacillus shoreicorticis]|uniref:Efflux RND transporter periplasmic adaptor subunit n=1 Tax=Sporolactobacillus shoreicorticis TaxID=1923877 RepID=A0ABW5S6E2_9BACL|nr:efflux RND transporter periplasmic adaptor subunit [Sporolactobacillus shoreicorticis]MCO7127371.1 efflux RND transporter periplasmic adaptor subunit [Sporolactobacillus shoreicorticis]
MKKIWILILVVVLAIGGGGAFWYFARDKSSANQTMIPTTTVQKGTISTDVSGSGSLEPTVDQDVTIDADDASKTIYSVSVAKNDKVEKGDKLLTFTDGTTLVAPKSGTVTSFTVYAGGRVNAGQTVAHLKSYDNLNTVLSIDELDIPKIKIGQTVSVVVASYPTKTFSGKVTSIAKEGTDTNGTSSFDVTVHLSKSTGLKPGMTTTANIVLEKKTNTLYLPSGAVHQSGDGYYVYLSSSSSNSNSSGQESGRFRNVETTRGKQQTVTVGIHNDQYIEVKSGLQEGQTVQLNAITRSTGTSSSSSSSRTQMMPSMNGGGFGGGQGSFGGGTGGTRGGNGGGNRP